MEKLTLEELNSFVMASSIREGKTLIAKALTELKEYKKIEEELGCPLDIYVKLHKIVYVYTKVGKCKLLKIQDGFIVVKVHDNTTYLPLKEYAETWWLKEDRSE